MSIDLKTIKHISKLSRISVDEERANKLAKDLSSIFEFIEKLNELKTDNVEPLTSIHTLKLICLKLSHLQQEMNREPTKGKEYRRITLQRKSITLSTTRKLR